MAKGKKAFVLYADLIHTVRKMPKDKAGELLMIILEYVNDLNPEPQDMMLDLVFEPIKQQLKRDLIKYEGKKKQWSEAGKASAEARRKLKEAEQNQQPLTDVESRSTDSTVTVTDTVIVKDIVTDKEKREKKFKTEVLKFHTHYSGDMLKSFCDYWTESSPKGKLMRFEKEKVFDIKRRLNTWEKREKNFAPKKEKKHGTSLENYLDKKI